MNLPHRSALVVIAVLAVLAYLPVFHINLIADDYPQIQISRLFARDGGAVALLADPSTHARVTFFAVSTQTTPRKPL